MAMRFLSCLVLTASAVAFTACGGGSSVGENTVTGPLVTDPVHVDSAGIESGTITLKMGVGELEVSSGAPSGSLVDGKLEYNVPSWKPKVVQAQGGKTAQLSIEQPSSTRTSSNSGGHTENHWTLQVAPTIPVTMDIECGVGNAKLDLGALKLRGLALNVGVGQIEVDLRGRPDHDYTVKIHGGVGETTVHLPTEAAIRANVQSGLVPVKVEGLEKHGDTWESAGSGAAAPVIRLEVEGGIGQIKIVR
jgi:hypothetical protein